MFVAGFVLPWTRQGYNDRVDKSSSGHMNSKGLGLGQLWQRDKTPLWLLRNSHWGELGVNANSALQL